MITFTLIIGSQERMYPLLSWKVWCCNKCDQAHHYKTLWKKLTALAYSVNSKQIEIEIEKNITFWNIWMWCDVWCRSSPCLCHISQMRPSRAVPALSLAVFWPSRTGPGGTPTRCRPLFHPARGRVTFNSNLKVTRAPARNIPWIKPGGAYGILAWLVGDPGGVPPVPSGCPSGSRSGPLYDFQGDTQLQRAAFINVQSINPSIN